MEIYKDESGTYLIKGNGFEANSDYIEDPLLPPKVSVNFNGEVMMDADNRYFSCFCNSNR